MKNFKPDFFLVFLLLISVFAGCKNGSDNAINDDGKPIKYYESIPVPSYISEAFGPFGPQEKSYTPPADAIYVAPKAPDSNSGHSADSPISLEKAMDIAETGSTIVLRGGTYRTGNLTFNKKITLQPYLKEKPVIKGSRIAANWETRGNYWVTKWETLFPREAPRWYKGRFDDGQACVYNNDLVMVDGNMYRPVCEPALLDSGTFYVDYASSEVYISENPAGKTIEITAFENGFVRLHDDTADREGPTFLGLNIMHYANSCVSIRGNEYHRNITEGEMPDAPVKTRIENCRILFCSRTGLSFNSPESYIAYNDISMHGNTAVRTNMSHNTIFEHNHICHSNWFKLKFFPAGIKVFNQSYNFIIRNNNFSENPCEAVWYDVGHKEGSVIKNYFNKCGIGVKIEISHRTYVAGNIFKEANLWICNSYNCMAYNNTLIDSRLDLWRNNRGHPDSELVFDTDNNYNHAATGPGHLKYHGHHVVNNVFAGKPGSGGYLLIEDNANFGEYIYDTNFQAEYIAQNCFLNEAEWTFNAAYQPKKLAARKYQNLDEFRGDYREFLEGNVQLNISQEELFRSLGDGDFRLKDLPSLPGGRELPENVARILDWKADNPGVGAMPNQ